MRKTDTGEFISIEKQKDGDWYPEYIINYISKVDQASALMYHSLTVKPIVIDDDLTKYRLFYGNHYWRILDIKSDKNGNMEIVYSVDNEKTPDHKVKKMVQQFMNISLSKQQKI
jgi:hypothetical protein